MRAYFRGQALVACIVGVLFCLGFKIIGIGPASMILFLTPTSQFLLGITYFDEILTLEKFFGFVIIWIAVSIYLNELRKE